MSARDLEAFVYDLLDAPADRYEWMRIYGGRDQFLASLSSVKVWGASNGGRLVLKELSRFGVEVECFIDSDAGKVGADLEGIPIKSPDAVRNGDVVVIATMHQSEVFHEHLAGRPIFIIPYDDFQNEIFRWNVDFIKTNLPALDENFRRLADQESREIFLSCIRFGITRDLSGVSVSDYPQYVHPAVKAEPGDVVIDGGAFRGDSLDKFFSSALGKCKVTCFEPMDDNCNALKAYADSAGLSGRVSLVRGALGATEGSAYLDLDAFSPQNNRLSNVDTGVAVPVYALDAYCGQNCLEPDLVKLDVEGQEMSVIAGGENTIAVTRPKLQVAVYHSPEDFVMIPSLLRGLNPRYKMYLGHHGGGGFWDTVLYVKDAGDDRN